MARRLTKGGHQCVVFDRNRENVNALAKETPHVEIFYSFAVGVVDKV